MTDSEGTPPRTLWTYAYQIEPPQFEDRLRSVRTLLDDEQARAGRGTRTWVGRVVTEERITHILVVSDRPDGDRGAKSRLEAELNRLRVRFSITASMQVADGAARPPPVEDHSD